MRERFAFLVSPEATSDGTFIERTADSQFDIGCGAVPIGWVFARNEAKTHQPGRKAEALGAAPTSIDSIKIEADPLPSIPRGAKSSKSRKV
jgi:hypothetical protein